MTAQSERAAIVAYMNKCAATFKRLGDPGHAREISYVVDCIESGSHHIKAKEPANG